MSGKNEVRKLFLARLKEKGITPPTQMRITRLVYRSHFSAPQPADYISLRWGKYAYGWLYHRTASFHGKPLSEGIDMLIIGYLAELKAHAEATSAREAAATKREEARRTRIEVLTARLKERGLTKLPAFLAVHGNGRLLFTLRLETFDGTKVGLYCQTECELSALLPDMGRAPDEEFLHCQLTLEGEQELR